MMKRILLLAVCLCLGLAGCRSSAGPGSQGSGDAEKATVPVVTMETPAGSEQAATPTETLSREELSSYLPSFGPTEFYDRSATFDDVTDDMVAAYAAQMEAAGLDVWKTKYQVLLHSDRIMLLLSRMEWAENAWMLHWEEAAPGAPIPDLNEIQAKFPDRKSVV